MLTKRPGRALQFWERYQGDLLNDDEEPEWPINIWLGTSIESQRYAASRLASLASSPSEKQGW